MGVPVVAGAIGSLATWDWWPIAAGAGVGFILFLFSGRIGIGEEGVSFLMKETDRIGLFEKSSLLKKRTSILGIQSPAIFWLLCGASGFLGVVGELIDVVPNPHRERDSIVWFASTAGCAVIFGGLAMVLKSMRDTK
jgi:hypothetical protein